MNYCGVLNLDKPAGMTSRDVVDHVVKLVHPAKVGHAGTLDPMATGVLVVCVGHATRLISVAQEGRKKYLGQFLLGQQSDTDDITGHVTHGGDWTAVTETALQSQLTGFIGRVIQVPPQFSAVHVKGQRAYKLARRGETVELTGRPVEIFSIKITDFQPPKFELEIECGSGTYIRSIGRDLGLQFGCGAVMTQLRRLAVDPFDVTNAVSLDKLDRESLDQFLQSSLNLVSHFQQRHLTIDEGIAIRRGQTIDARRREVQSEATSNEPPVGSRTALIGADGNLMGIGEIHSKTGQIQPRIVFPLDL